MVAPNTDCYHIVPGGLWQTEMGGPLLTDEADALDRLANNTLGCYGFAYSTTGDVSDGASDASTDDSLRLAATASGSDSSSIKIGAVINSATAAVITATWTVSDYAGGATTLTMIDATNSTTVGVIVPTAASGSASFPATPEQGNYYLVIQVTGVTASCSADVTFASSHAMVPLPVVVQYDDGAGGNFELQKCPRDVLPGDTKDVFYGLKTDAEAALASTSLGTDGTDIMVMSCIASVNSADSVGRIQNPTGTATLSGTSATFTLSCAEVPPPGGGQYEVDLDLWTRYQFLAGTTLTLSGTFSATDSSHVSLNYALLRADYSTYDEAAFDHTGGASLDVGWSVTVTDPGLYYLVTVVIALGTSHLADDGVSTVWEGGTASLDITASWDRDVTTYCPACVTLAPIAASYDRGIDCPAKLDCT